MKTSQGQKFLSPETIVRRQRRDLPKAKMFGSTLGQAGNSLELLGLELSSRDEG